MGLIFIVAANDEGLPMAEVGSIPNDDFAAYTLNVLDASHEITDTSALGESVCSAIVLQGGRMLIMNKADIAGQAVYVSIMCSRVPTGMQALIKRIVDTITHAMNG